MIQLNVDTWLKVVAIAVSAAIALGLPMTLACLEIRDAAQEQRRATSMMEKHVENASLEFKLGTVERGRLDVRVSVLEDRVLKR